MGCGGGGLQGFVEGGMASVAAGCATHPLDLIKVRMQLQVSHQPAFSTTTTHSAFALQPQPSQPLPSPLHPSQPFTPSSSHGPLSMATRIIRTEGAPALFSGISATILRQTLYSSTRLGIYEALTASTPTASCSSNNNNNNPLPHTGETMKLMKKIGAGIIAGGVGAAIGNPADVALVRMQADGRLPINLRRNYAGVGDALFTIVKQEGLHTLWRGSSLTIHRAMVVTAAQLTTYDEAKEQLLRRSGMKDGVPIHVASSFLAGLVASAASNPIDVIKTRIMSMKRECGPGSPMSCGALDCAIKTVKLEGFMSLYKGFTPTVMRQGPYTVVLFVTLEQIRKLFGQPSS